MLYNITFNVDQDIQEQWLHWLKEKYIAKVMQTGLFLKYRFYRLLSEVENDGITYALQFYAESLDDIDTYIEDHAPAIVHEQNEKFKHRQVAFMTLLESVEI